jgi:uncharacterized integral membrane protein
MSTSEFTPGSATRDRTPSSSETPTIETSRQRTIEPGKRARPHTWAYAAVALFVVLIALIANTNSVRLNWVVGSTRASLVWIVLASAVLGWLLGIVTTAVVRHRARDGRSDDDRRRNPQTRPV